jgi:hypothetical protein
LNSGDCPAHAPPRCKKRQRERAPFSRAAPFCSGRKSLPERGAQNPRLHIRYCFKMTYLELYKFREGSFSQGPARRNVNCRTLSSDGFRTKKFFSASAVFGETTAKKVQKKFTVIQKKRAPIRSAFPKNSRSAARVRCRVCF